MSNTWFQFKQFTLHQDKCAMKVATDSCLFGGWVAARVSHLGEIKNALDIGTGTGLLSLMVAQKNSRIQIDAVELDPLAAIQAAENVASSPFEKQVTVHATDIAAFQPNVQYDLIFSNPPFYEDQLRSDNVAKNKAHHETGLTLAYLLNISQLMLSPEGTLALLLPFYRQAEVILLASQLGFQVHQICTAKQSTSHSAFRVMFLLSKLPAGAVLEECITIRETNNVYGHQFQSLLRDYYLNL